MACKEHPNYGGLRTPRTDCKGCWNTYNAVHGKPEKEEPKPVIVVSSPPKEEKKKRGRVAADAVAMVSEPVKIEVQPEPLINKVEVPKYLKELVAEEADKAIKAILEAKLRDFRTRLAAEISISTEHLFIYDRHWTPQLLKFLETEGWGWKSHTYPLADRGIISKEMGDYTLMTRIKKEGNAPIPDFTIDETRKEYAKKIKKYQENGNKVR